MTIMFQNFVTIRVALVFLMVILMAPLTGCGDANIFEGVGDEDTKEAQIEAALIAMDDGDYQTAIDILTTLVQENPGDAQLLQYLGSAYSGSAGLDTLDMLEVIDALDATGESGNIDMIGLVLGDANGQLTSAEVTTKLESINSAIATINMIATPNDDQTILLGVLSMTHLSLTMADLIMADLGRDDVILTEDGIDSMYGSNPADFSGATTDTLTTIEQDLANISAAIEALEALSDENNDIAQDFMDFENALDQNGDGRLSSAELASYIDNL